MYLLLVHKTTKHSLAILVSAFIIVGCKQQTETIDKKNTEVSYEDYGHQEIPNIHTDKALIEYERYTSTYTLNKQLYSGYIAAFYEDGTSKEKVGILNGKKQDRSTYWFPSGKLKQTAIYHKGKLHGTKKVWSNEFGHNLIAQFNYENGKAHGEQTQWYKTGELYKKLNLYKGTENGIQQAFRKNGELYANYEAKNGRIFGLKKSALCYGLENEKIKTR